MIDPLLEQARQARADGDGEGCRRALADAQRAAAGGERLVTVCWRRAKAEHDFGDAHGVLDALTPLLAQPDPFAGSEAALSATETLARQVRDALGYASPVPDALLRRAAEAWRRRDDPVRALWVEVQLAWSLACRGELLELRALLTEAERLRPRDVRQSQSRHARAKDAAESLAWMQLDLARAVLRGATWVGDVDATFSALESLEDAAEDTGLRRLADPWFLENAVAAALLLGETPDPDYLAAWPTALATADAPRRALHDALRVALLGEAPFTPAAELAAASGLGPEWEAWAWQGALRSGEAGAALALDQLVSTRGVTAFAPER
ncbi:MAG: hypothetical protein EP330_02245 [Deltaproteobacteria bacterium]|nr:MAG: hypothetical protein EP330_02245 [Deltaproteobacteria bacterium]